MIAGSVLTQILLQLQLSLQQLLALLLHHHLAVVLVLQQLLIQDTNERVLVVGDVLAHLSIRITKLLDDCLDNFFIESD